jgi:hypothetical protein
MTNKIKIVKNFLSKDECQSLIRYIDSLTEMQKNQFSIYQNGKRLALQFGTDLYHEDASHLTLDIVSDKESIFRKYFSSVINQINILFEDKDPMYVSSFWIAKQFPGAIVPEHEDTDGGINTHFEYSSIIYLNSLKDSGDLIFDSLSYSYRPNAGDLIIFSSKSTGTHKVEKINEDRYSLPMWVTKNTKFIL